MHHLTNNRFYGTIVAIGSVVMKENKLVELSMDFSVDIINLVKFLKSNHETIYRTKYIDEQTFKALSSKCTSLRVMLIASCKTAKENNK